MNDNEKYIEKFVKDIPFDAPNEKHRDELKKQLLNGFPRHRLQPTVHAVRVRRIIMNKPLIKLAAAAAIVIAVLIGLNVIPSGGGVAWGELLDNINELRTFAYRFKLNMVGMPEESEAIELQAEVRVAAEYGVRTISYMKGELHTKTYLSIPEKVAVTVIPKAKVYLRQTVTDELFEKMARQNCDPRKLVQEFMKYEYTELGRRTIDGVEVEGIECRDSRVAASVISGVAGEMVDNVVGRLWAAVEDDLPVKLEIEVFGKDGEKKIDMVTYEYQWNIDVDPNEFEPEIPDEYKLAADVEVSADEKSVLEGLGFFAEYADGRYPSELSAMTMARELRDALTARYGGDPPWPPKPGDEQRVFGLEAAIRFYAQLVMEDKDPAYHGDRVTAEFPDAVLMRWKTEGDKYRIVFGDLTVGEATADELAELESAPLNTRTKAIKPQPADGAVGAHLSGLVLSWMPGAHVTEHKVYFGTGPENPALLAEISDTVQVEAPALERDTSYYWRVDEVQSDGKVVTGDTWSFNTGHLVAWWKFDEGTGNVAADSSRNGHDGTLSGNPTWAEGAIGGALLLDSDGDYVDVGKDSDFDITGQITISAWIKVNAFDKDWQAIVTKGDGAWRLQRNWGSNTLEFGCSGLLVPGTRWGQIFGAKDVNDAQWHHVVGVYDGQKIFLYVDGSLDASAEASGTIRVHDRPVYIGANSEKPDRNWNGLIDDVRIYNYALSADEIATIAQDVTALPPK
ncbi:MAG: hypothetical protein JSU70_02815 [Phycisphaerales bacterium]|nr:MAG: hypothetical protein JSU70_02815 [Phycisphaerales bacterium]